MLDENEICEEVVALIDRMDKFPEEFLNDSHLHHRWGTVMGHIQRANDDSVFTAAELRVLREKVQGLARLRMKKEILTNIMHGGESGMYGAAVESSSYYGSPLGTAINSMPIAKLSATGTGPSWVSIAEEQKEETRRMIEEYKQMMREEIEQTRKSKVAKKAAY